MKLNIPPDNLKNSRLPPQIFYKPNPTIGKTLTDKSDSLMVDIKTQPGDRDSKTVVIYMPLFWTGSPEALLNFVILLKNIIRGQDLSTGPQKFGMTRKLVTGEALRVFEQKYLERGMEANVNY